MPGFDLHKLREIADEGIARHGLRGYARKLGLDVSTMRSLRDGRDMQISKVMEIVTALNLSLELRRVDGAPRAPIASANAGAEHPDTPETAGDDAFLPVVFHPGAPQGGTGPVAFAASWLRAQGWQAPQLSCVIAPERQAGNCVPPGALCLLDCSSDWPGHHAIWAYLDKTMLRISYLCRPDPGVLLVSGPDPAVPARHVTGPALDTIVPLGRVIWTGAPAGDLP